MSKYFSQPFNLLQNVPRVHALNCLPPFLLTFQLNWYLPILFRHARLFPSLCISSNNPPPPPTNNYLSLPSPKALALLTHTDLASWVHSQCEFNITVFSTSREPGTAKLHEVRICPQWRGESQNRYWAISTNLFNLRRSSWLMGRLKTDNLTKLFRSDNEIEREEDRLETEVSHNMKEQTFLNWPHLRVQSSHILLSHVDTPQGSSPVFCSSASSWLQRRGLYGKWQPGGLPEEAAKLYLPGEAAGRDHPGAPEGASEVAEGFLGGWGGARPQQVSQVPLQTEALSPVSQLGTMGCCPRVG